MDAFPLPPPRFTGTARKVEFMNAFEWLRQGWAMFMTAPTFWLTLGVGLLLFFGVFEFLFLFTLATMTPGIPQRLVSGFLLFFPVVMLPTVTVGGLQACRRLAAGEVPRFADLAWGFNEKRRPLLAAGALILAGWLALFAFYTVVKGPLALFLPTIAGFAFLMAAWFLPVLVGFHDMPLFSALRASFLAGASNLGAFVAFGFVMMVLHFLALLPLGLGIPVLLPFVFGAMHASYRDVFPES